MSSEPAPDEMEPSLERDVAAPATEHVALPDLVTNERFCAWFANWFQNEVCRDPRSRHASSAITLALQGYRGAALRNFAYSFVPLCDKASFCSSYTLQFGASAAPASELSTEGLSSSAAVVADDDCGARCDDQLS